MSRQESLLSKIYNNPNNPDLAGDELEILRNAITHNLPVSRNGLNVPELRTLLGYRVPQADVNDMKRAELIKKLKIHFMDLLDFSPPRRRSLSPQRRHSSLSPQRGRSRSPQRRSSLSPLRRRSPSPPAPVLAPVPPDAPPALLAPVDIFQSFLPPHLVNILDRYSIPPPPIEGKFVKEIALDGVPRYVVCHAGKAYVTHPKGGRMSVLDVESGALVDEWTIPGAGWLGGVAVHGEHLFVADYEKHCIRVLDMEGKQERQFGTSGSGNG